MKPQVKTITGITSKGRKGTRFEHDIKIGSKVKTADGREGVVISDGICGMPEVEYPDGCSDYCFPGQLEIIE